MIKMVTPGKSFSPSTALWSDSLALHSLKNVGIEDIHIISVELKHTMQVAVTIAFSL